MGASFELDHGVLIGKTDGLKGVEINLPYASVGATENTLLAAVLAEGTTVIENAAREPEVVDLIKMLKNMGADITGEGSSEIVINGVNALNSTNHKVIGDRIVAGTYIGALLSTNGNGKIVGINPKLYQWKLKNLLRWEQNFKLKRILLRLNHLNNCHQLIFLHFHFQALLLICNQYLEPHY